MNYWIVIHNSSAYEQHENLFSLPEKKDKFGKSIKNKDGSFQPHFRFFDDIKIGDKIVYYFKWPISELIGLFEIMAGPAVFTENWTDRIQYKIKPLLVFQKNNRISYEKLRLNLPFFKRKDGNPYKEKSASNKINGPIKPLTEDDFICIVELYNKKLNDSSEIIKNKHILKNLGIGYPKADDLDEPPRSIQSIITRKIRDSKLSTEHKELYDYKCQICNKTLSIMNKNSKNVENYNEVHHIIPLGKNHNGLDKTSNMLVLCPNHHAEFDFGAIAVNTKDFSINHIDEKNEYHEKMIFVHDRHKIDIRNLEYHFEKIFRKNK